MTQLMLLITGILVSSGVSSMVEAAILSLPLIKARVLSEQKRKGAKDLLIIKEDIHTAVATIVIINNSINIIGSIFVGRMVTALFGSQWLGMASAILTFFIIILSEVIPKTLGEHHKVPIALMISKPLRGIIFLLKPIVSMVSLITSFMRGKSSLPKVTEEEIKSMLKLGHRDGTVELDEQVLCNRVFKLNDLKALNMMKPLDGVYRLQADKTLAEAKEPIMNSPYSRIIIYGKDASEVVGISQQRILLRELSRDNYEAQVKAFMTKPIFVSENVKADTLLERFQAYHQHLFVVRDRKGRNIGIISMEDVLEELFGEIYDEKDTILKRQQQN